MAYTYVTSKGVILPETDLVLLENQEMFKTVFGDDFITDPESPQGELVSMFTNFETRVIQNNALLANQFNPIHAGGKFLDATCALFSISRNVASRSRVTCTLTGVVDTFIPAGAQVRSTNLNYWALLDDVRIPSTGTIDAVFESISDGARSANAGTITTIISHVFGWETVTNASSASLGTDLETDASLSNRRILGLATQSTRTVDAIKGALDKVTGVTSFAFLNNRTSSPLTTNTQTLVPHSVWVAVSGGTDTDVALALKNSVGDGTGFNGVTGSTGSTIQEAIVDPTTGDSEVITFVRPATVSCSMRVKLKLNGQNYSKPDIKDLCVEVLTGQTSFFDGFEIGQDVIPFELSGFFQDHITGVTVTEVTVGIGSGTKTTDITAISVVQIAEIAKGDMQVNFV